MFFRRKKATYIILMYHKIDIPSDYFPSLDPEIFQKQIEFIRKKYSIISLEDILNGKIIKENKKPKFIITFDDGYRCIYKYAYPILKKYNMPATVFLTVESIEKNIPIWTDILAYYIKTTSQRKLKIRVQHKEYLFDLSDETKKLIALKQLKNILKMIDDKEREEIMSSLKNKLEVDTPNEEILYMLSWDKIREMAKNNISFGSHTMTHPILTRVSLGTAGKEIFESKRIIEEKIGKPVITFAYPNGEAMDFNAQIKNLVKEAGYKVACTTIYGSNNCDTDPYELRRVYTSEQNIIKFAWRIFKLRWS